MNGKREQKEYLHTLKDSTEQLAHITIVQPIGMLTLLSECLVASLGKTEYLVSQLCPCRFCNDKIFHSSIVNFLFYFLFCALSQVSVCKITVCLLYFKALGNSSETLGT